MLACARMHFACAFRRNHSRPFAAQRVEKEVLGERLGWRSTAIAPKSAPSIIPRASLDFTTTNQQAKVCPHREQVALVHGQEHCGLELVGVGQCLAFGPGAEEEAEGPVVADLVAA